MSLKLSRMMTSGLGGSIGRGSPIKSLLKCNGEASEELAKKFEMMERVKKNKRFDDKHMALICGIAIG